MEPDPVLVAAFARDLRNILVNERELGLSSSRFAQMLDEYGELEAAHRLLDPKREFPKGTFSYLRDRNRLDLTMEFYVVMPKYAALFPDPEEQVVAAFRLASED